MARVEKRPGAGSRKLEMLLRTLGTHKSRVGWFESAKYPNGEPVAAVAMVHEYGSAPQGIPPRPFMRPAIDENQRKWANVLAKAIEAGMTEAEAMDMLGTVAEGDVAKVIAKLQEPALAEETVKARQRGYADKETVGSLTKPLVHTGIMLNSLTHITEAK